MLTNANNGVGDVTVGYLDVLHLSWSTMHTTHVGQRLPSRRCNELTQRVNVLGKGEVVCTTHGQSRMTSNRCAMYIRFCARTNAAVRQQGVLSSLAKDDQI